VPARVATAAPVIVTLGTMLTAFMGTVDVKRATKVRMEQARTAMVDHFTEGRDVSTITERDAETWRAQLKADGYAPATISRTVLYARQMFRWGVKRGMVPANPFADLKAGSQVNTARQVFIDRPTIAKVIDAAPDAAWRLLIALGRFGGLRIPSEALGMTWQDVDWEHNRLTIRSPKTEHHEGRGERIIPLFPEVREHLQTVYDQAPEGSVYVIHQYRNGQNINPQLHRIVKRAGLKVWPRAWHNLRASRQTELASSYPLHTVCAWIGNTKAIAAGHYLQVTDADWQRACAQRVQAVAVDGPQRADESEPTPRQTDKNADGHPSAPIDTELCGQGRT
jgi:integrase